MSDLDLSDIENTHERMEMNGAGQPAEQQQHGGQAFQLIDTKLLGKPTNFSGLDKDYKEWAFSFSCWFSCICLLYTSDAADE